MILKAKSCKLKAPPGFSLIEMLVVLTIFLIITGVILANLPSFRDKTALELIAQEIAVTIRQAQVYGIGTRSSGAAFSSHGLAFPYMPGTDNKFFVVFADINPDGVYSDSYNCAEIDQECVEKFEIRGAAKIASWHGCTTVADCEQIINDLIILFRRFYPEANFGVGSPYSHVKILVESTKEPSLQREVVILNTGQISVIDPNS